MSIRIIGLIAVLIAPALCAGSWKDDPIWYDGKAEYAVYAASRSIYGVARNYDAVIITNKQQMDPGATTKAADWRDPDTVEVFKHNVSEIIPTENYDYRFLTTSFVRTDDLSPFKLVMSSQEDCGSSYKQITSVDRRWQALSHVYFPDAGETRANGRRDRDYQQQDNLSLVLRDYPFEADEHPEMKLSLVPDLTHARSTILRPIPATVHYGGKETLDLPIGSTEAYRLDVRSDDPGATATYWFAADSGPEKLNILVKYNGPNGVSYELKHLTRWSYWDRSAPTPDFVNREQ